MHQAPNGTFPIYSLCSGASSPFALSLAVEGGSKKQGSGDKPAGPQGRLPEPSSLESPRPLCSGKVGCRCESGPCFFEPPSHSLIRLAEWGVQANRVIQPKEGSPSVGFMEQYHPRKRCPASPEGRRPPKARSGTGEISGDEPTRYCSIKPTGGFSGQRAQVVCITSTPRSTSDTKATLV